VLGPAGLLPAAPASAPPPLLLLLLLLLPLLLLLLVLVPAASLPFRPRRKDTALGCWLLLR
jgi:hypothetical protein